MTPAEHKKLALRKTFLLGELKARRKELSSVGEQIAKIDNELAEVDKQLKQPVDITISEHACMRYLERVQGMDMAELVETIKDEFQLRDLGSSDAVCKLTRGDWTLVIKENTLITIEEAK